MAAFGNSFEFAGVRLDQITDVQYSTYNADDPPLVRPIAPNRDQPSPRGRRHTRAVPSSSPPSSTSRDGSTGWETHANALADDAWYLTGDEGDDHRLQRGHQVHLRRGPRRAGGHADTDTAPPAISTGIYFGLGAGPDPAETAVDRFVLNGYVFDFEPMGVFVTPTP